MERTEIYVGGEEVRVLINNDGSCTFTSKSGTSGIANSIEEVKRIVEEKQQRSKK